MADSKGYFMDAKGIRFFKDKLHGITAMCRSKTMAWGLIRKECHSRKIQVPTMDMIYEVEKETREERRQQIHDEETPEPPEEKDEHGDWSQFISA